MTEIQAEAFKNCTRAEWDTEIEGTDRITFTNESFPAQIEVSRVVSDPDWSVGLYIYNDQRGFLDLLSAEYHEEFDTEDTGGVCRCIQQYMGEIENGELDEYRADINIA